MNVINEPTTSKTADLRAGLSSPASSVGSPIGSCSVQLRRGSPSVSHTPSASSSRPRPASTGFPPSSTPNGSTLHHASNGFHYLNSPARTLGEGNGSSAFTSPVIHNRLSPPSSGAHPSAAPRLSRGGSPFIPPSPHPPPPMSPVKDPKSPHRNLLRSLPQPPCTPPAPPSPFKGQQQDPYPTNSSLDLPYRGYDGSEKVKATPIFLNSPESPHQSSNGGSTSPFLVDERLHTPPSPTTTLDDHLPAPFKTRILKSAFSAAAPANRNQRKSPPSMSSSKEEWIKRLPPTPLSSALLSACPAAPSKQTPSSAAIESSQGDYANFLSTETSPAIRSFSDSGLDRLVDTPRSSAGAMTVVSGHHQSRSLESATTQIKNIRNSEARPKSAVDLGQAAHPVLESSKRALSPGGPNNKEGRLGPEGARDSPLCVEGKCRSKRRGGGVGNSTAIPINSTGNPLYLPTFLSKNTNAYRLPVRHNNSLGGSSSDDTRSSSGHASMSTSHGSSPPTPVIETTSAAITTVLLSSPPPPPPTQPLPHQSTPKALTEFPLRNADGSAAAGLDEIRAAIEELQLRSSEVGRTGAKRGSGESGASYSTSSSYSSRSESEAGGSVE
ncbi:unnamed protein product, partial [Cyprideis torosa]